MGSVVVHKMPDTINPFPLANLYSTATHKMSPNPETDSSLDADPDTILRVMPYQRKYSDLCLVRARPRHHDQVRSSFFRVLSRSRSSRILRSSRSSGLGRLERLPPELLTSICLELDIRSALKFSHVNRSTRQFIATIPECCRLREHALECIWAAFRSRFARDISIATLHSVLVTECCEVCGSFGNLFFLPTAVRCCPACIRSAPAVSTVNIEALARAVGLSPHLCDSIRVSFTSKGSKNAVVRFASAYHVLGSLGSKYGDCDVEAVVRDNPVVRLPSVHTVAIL